jgi:hypothetical protein
LFDGTDFTNETANDVWHVLHEASAVQLPTEQSSFNQQLHCWLAASNSVGKSRHPRQCNCRQNKLRNKRRSTSSCTAGWQPTQKQRKFVMLTGAGI